MEFIHTVAYLGVTLTRWIWCPWNNNSSPGKGGQEGRGGEEKGGMGGNGRREGTGKMGGDFAPPFKKS